MQEAIDVSEMENIEAFIINNEALLAAEDSATLTSLREQVINIFNTPAENLYMTQEEMVEMLVLTNQDVVRLIGMNSEEALVLAFTTTLIGA
jgi:hypothetical protein